MLVAILNSIFLAALEYFLKRNFKRKFYGGGTMVDSFPAYVISEQTGLRYKVRVVRSSSTTHVGTGGRVHLPELTSLLLDDGRRLTIHGDNRFVATNGESFATAPAQ